MSAIKTTIHVALADDHPMVVQGVANMLEGVPHILLEEVYEHGRILLTGLQRKQPDVLLLDLHMPHHTGIEILPELVRLYPDMSILVLTNVEDPVIVEQMLEKGALGYLLKSTDKDHLVQAIESVHRGKQFIDAAVKEILLDHVLEEKKKALSRPTFTRREQEMLQLIVEGLNNKEIAAKLFLGQRTVETYRLNMMMKLGVKNLACLIRKAIEEKWV